MQAKYAFLTYYDPIYLEKLGTKFQTVKIRVICYISFVMMLIGLIFFVLLGFNTQQNYELGFYFNTSLFVLLFIIFSLFSSWFNLVKSQNSLSIVKNNLDQIDDYLFKQHLCSMQKAIIGVQNRNMLFIISHNEQQQYYAVFALNNGIHESEVTLVTQQYEQLNKVLTHMKYFKQINENW